MNKKNIVSALCNDERHCLLSINIKFYDKIISWNFCTGVWEGIKLKWLFYGCVTVSAPYWSITSITCLHVVLFTSNCLWYLLCAVALLNTATIVDQPSGLIKPCEVSSSIGVLLKFTRFLSAQNRYNIYGLSQMPFHLTHRSKATIAG